MLICSSQYEVINLHELVLLFSLKIKAFLEMPFLVHKRISIQRHVLSLKYLIAHVYSQQSLRYFSISRWPLARLSPYNNKIYR